MPEDGKPQSAFGPGFDIEAMALDESIQSAEGLDVNHSSRLRMHFLVAQHASMITQTQFADAKAAALMTVMGLVAMNGPVKIGQTTPNDLLAIVIFALMMGTIAIAMAAILPRYPDAKLNLMIKRRERFAWPALVANGYSPLDHAEFMRTAEASQLVVSIAQTNSAMAMVLKSKFRALRMAFLLGALDIALIVLYVLTNR